MFGEKNFLKSKTIQGVLTFVAGFLMSKGWIPEVNPEMLVNEVITWAGATWALYGRFATKGEKLKLK